MGRNAAPHLHASVKSVGFPANQISFLWSSQRVNRAARGYLGISLFEAKSVYVVQQGVTLVEF